MSAPQKFLFDRSFDLPRRREEEEAAREEEALSADFEGEGAEAEEDQGPPPEEMITKSDHEAALEQARSQGVAEGIQKGNEEAWARFRTETDQVAVRYLRTIADNMQAIHDEQIEARAKAEADAKNIAVSVVRKVMPEFAKRHGLAEVEAIVVDCIRRLIEEPRIVITAHDSLLEALHHRLRDVVEDVNYGGRLALQADESSEENDVASTNVKVQWTGGGAERDAGRMWAEINAAIERHFGFAVDSGPAGDGSSPDDGAAESELHGGTNAPDGGAMASMPDDAAAGLGAEEENLETSAVDHDAAQAGALDADALDGAEDAGAPELTAS